MEEYLFGDIRQLLVIYANNFDISWVHHSLWKGDIQNKLSRIDGIELVL